MLNRHRLLGAVAVLALGAGACISSEPPPAPVVPAEQVDVTELPQSTDLQPATDAQVSAVEEYWEARDEAFAAGAEAGIAFLVENNHPQLPYTVDDCRESWFGGEIPPGFAERTALDPSSVLQDPDFMMATGPIAGRMLEPDVLVMNVAFRYEGAPSYVPDRVSEVHLQAVGDDVRNFMLCDTEEITVVEAPSGGAATGASTATDTDADAITDEGTTTLPGATVVTLPDGSQAIVLPPITATPGTTDPTTAPTMAPMPAPPPPPPGSRPTGTGIDFCDSGDPGAQPVAGDYFLCPDDDRATDMPMNNTGGAD